MCQQHTQSLPAFCQDLSWIVNLQKSDLVPQQVFNFVGYQYDLKQGIVSLTSERWEVLNSKIRTLLKQKQCTVRHFGETFHVSVRPSHHHQKTGSLRTFEHDTDSVASKRKLAHPRVFGKVYPYSKVPSQAPTVVATRRQCPSRPTPTHQTKDGALI